MVFADCLLFIVVCWFDFAPFVVASVWFVVCVNLVLFAGLYVCCQVLVSGCLFEWFPDW